MVDRPKDDKTTLSQDTAEQFRHAPGPRASLVIYHRDQVKLMPLPEGAELVVGRAWPSDVVVQDPSLSRQHARFCRVSEGVEVEDLGSTNGTHVRGERIQKALLGPGESVSLGSVTVSLNLASASSGLLDGIEPYEQFFARLGDELVRARTFRRPLALLMVRALGMPDELHVSRWVPRMRNTLRPVDRVALYGDAAALVALVETDRDRARTVASALVEGSRLGEPTLLCGVALTGGHAHELVDRARQLSRQATTEARVVLEGDAPEEVGARAPVFASPAMMELRRIVERVAVSTIPVLVHGETGSGKEVVARAIHDSSQRKDGPLRSVNCGAMPANLLETQLFGHEKGAFTGAERTTPGLFEQASGGTLFLDEVGELSAAAQAALLRVLETSRLMRVGGTEEIAVDVRVVAATHRDVEAMVRDGGFRQDLLYRLNTMTLQVPPLRDRPEDLRALVTRFLDEASRASGGVVQGIEPDAMEVLERHGWPGNVRELRNIIERAVVVSQGPRVTVDDLPDNLVRGQSASVAPPGVDEAAPEDDAAFKDRVKAYETRLILDALKRTDGNQTQAAKLLRMPLRTLVHKIRSYGIKKSFDAD